MTKRKFSDTFPSRLSVPCFPLRSGQKTRRAYINVSPTAGYRQVVVRIPRKGLKRKSFFAMRSKRKKDAA
jgi:hypothetical protein